MTKEELSKKLGLEPEEIEALWPNNPSVILKGIPITESQIEQLASEMMRCVKIVADAYLNKIMERKDLYVRIEHDDPWCLNCEKQEHKRIEYIPLAELEVK